MGKCWKYLHDLYQTFTYIKSLTVMNVYQILIMYLIQEKNNGKGNLKRLVMCIEFKTSYGRKSAADVEMTLYHTCLWGRRPHLADKVFCKRMRLGQFVFFSAEFINRHVQ